MDKDLIQKHIKEENGQYAVLNQEGNRKFGSYPSKQQAMDRLKQIETQKLWDQEKEYSKIEEILEEVAKQLKKDAPELVEKKEEPKKENNLNPAIDYLNKATQFLQAAIDSGELPDLRDVKEIQRPSFTTKKNEAGELEWNINIPIIKVDTEQRLVEGIVYEPDVIDAQNDSASPEEIVKAAHGFMMNARRIGLMHQYDVSDKVPIVESYIAKSSFFLNGQMIKKGTWMMVLKINDPDLWQDVKDKKITGLSMGGRARAG